MFESFKLELDGGNDAMQTTDDVVRALHRIAGEIEAGAWSGRIRDDNGNTVGDYSFTEAAR